MSIKKILKLILLSVLSIIVILVTVMIYFATDLFSTQPELTASKTVAVVDKNEDTEMKIQFIRHATALIVMENKKILVDPMLGDIGTESPYPLTANRVKNPMIPLPVEKDSLLKDIDAVLITHYHPDHFDREAENTLPKDMLIFCQPGDDEILKVKGFTNVQAIENKTEFGELSITRFPVNHGEGIWQEPMGKSSSFYIEGNIETKNESVFITGDAIFDELLETGLKETQANLIVANAGAAQFIIGKPITLTSDALNGITQLLPDTRIIAVHMDAINHCKLTKDKLKKYIAEENLAKNIDVPNEGDVLSFQ